MQKIIYSDKTRLERTLEKIKKDGIKKLHILTDFDRTLTKAFINGKRRHSLIHSLEEKGYLGKDFSKIYKKHFDYYYPIEIDSNISLKEKSEKMKEWWEKTNELLIKSNLNRNDIRKIVNDGLIEFRDGVKEFLGELNKNNIPLIIISASGLGVESIKIFLEKNNVFYDNINIISNDFTWNENGYAIGYKKPVIHTFNKDETVLENFPEIYKKIKNRKNLILLGDSLGDHHMVDGFDYKNLIKIGFLNEIPHPNPLLGEESGQKEIKLLEEYKKRYDIVITGDGNFGEVNNILNEIKS